MTQYHAVMSFCGEEFGADVEASTREEAYAKLRENYPESSCVQLESPDDTRAREARIYADAARGIDYDEDGRPFSPYDYDDEDEEEDEE